MYTNGHLDPKGFGHPTDPSCGNGGDGYLPASASGGRTVSVESSRVLPSSRGGSKGGCGILWSFLAALVVPVLAPWGVCAMTPRWDRRLGSDQGREQASAIVSFFSLFIFEHQFHSKHNALSPQISLGTECCTRPCHPRATAHAIDLGPPPGEGTTGAPQNDCLGNVACIYVTWGLPSSPSLDPQYSIP